MRFQSITLILGLCASAIAFPRVPQDEKHLVKSQQGSLSLIKTFSWIPPSPTRLPGHDNDSGEFPFPWPTDGPDSGDNGGSSGEDPDDASDMDNSTNSNSG
ncbi:hypothetical protein BDV29DRAFT_157178 [Aspergillus leporis]|jgi:hypothetical protein|uniref:Uncharacterized protein n=1 Tax=Aspergillus leporis TaxID=41062 RepID=A0A5N5WZA8_9EURO|nr:hypothetical protein BDV29DRAFT_157178 [Aspergillus leporis]